jgi:ATP-grasp domain
MLLRSTRSIQFRQPFFGRVVHSRYTIVFAVDTPHHISSFSPATHCITIFHLSDGSITLHRHKIIITMASLNLVLDEDSGAGSMALVNSTSETLSLANESMLKLISCNSNDDNALVNHSKAENINAPLAVNEENLISDSKNGGSGEIRNWTDNKYFSELIDDGLKFLGQSANEVIMIYECPSSSGRDTSFFNAEKYRIHDFPPTLYAYKVVLRPIRYSSMNGNTHPSFLAVDCPVKIIEHWEKYIPNFCRPSFVNSIPPTAKVNAYLPMEKTPHHLHINNPDIHYFLAGKDAINLMTESAPRLLPNAKDVRPCVVKVTHAMGSLGIFVIHNDTDEENFLDFVKSTENPSYVITDFVEIVQNLSCHFFIHPNGDIIWFGSSENLRLADGSWSIDSTMEMLRQQELQDLMGPLAKQVVDYSLSRGYWGFCGIDVLVGPDGRGWVVDVNPRVTGTMPALMVAKQIHNQLGLQYGKFRKSSKYAYAGPADELWGKIDEYNELHQGCSRIVVFSFFEVSSELTQCNMAVFGDSHEACEAVLDTFLQLKVK